jgi:hypothetical protein
MKRISSLAIKSLVSILIGSGTLAANLQAQNALAITATISFPFTMGTKIIVPGTYRFSPLAGPAESGQFLLSVVNMRTGDMEIFPVRPERQRSTEQHGRLIFHNSTGHNVLGEVHFPGTDTFIEVIQRRRAETAETKPASIGSSIAVAQR